MTHQIAVRWPSVLRAAGWTINTCLALLAIALFVRGSSMNNENASFGFLLGLVVGAVLFIVSSVRVFGYPVDPQRWLLPLVLLNIVAFAGVCRFSGWANGWWVVDSGRVISEQGGEWLNPLKVGVYWQPRTIMVRADTVHESRNGFLVNAGYQTELTVNPDNAQAITAVKEITAALAVSLDAEVARLLRERNYQDLTLHLGETAVFVNPNRADSGSYNAIWYNWLEHPDPQVQQVLRKYHVEWNHVAKLYGFQAHYQ